MVFHYLLGRPLDDEAQLLLNSALDGLHNETQDIMNISRLHYFSAYFPYIIIIVSCKGKMGNEKTTCMYSFVRGF